MSQKRILRSKDPLVGIYLIGSCELSITGVKLPSKGQVLRVLMYNIRAVKLSVRGAARLAVREAIVFWEKARVPTQKECHMIDKLTKIYERWEKLGKSRTKPSVTQETAEQKFNDELDDLFDIASSGALNLMSNEEDRKFLLAQRQKGRPGSMIGADCILAGTEKRKKARMEQEELRKQKHYAEMAQQNGEN